MLALRTLAYKLYSLFKLFTGDLKISFAFYTFYAYVGADAQDCEFVRAAGMRLFHSQYVTDLDYRDLHRRSVLSKKLLSVRNIEQYFSVFAENGGKGSSVEKNLDLSA